MNLPNFLTLLRCVMTLGFIWLFWTDIDAAALLFVLAALTDFYDGYLARKHDMITTFGKIMDPIADKFLIISAFAVFAVVNMVSWWMFWMITMREIGVTAFRFWAMSKGKVLAAEQAGKIKTVLQIATICLLLLLLILVNHWVVESPSLHVIPVIAVIHLGAIALLWLSVIITVVSGILVIWNNRDIVRASSTTMFF